MNANKKREKLIRPRVCLDRLQEKWTGNEQKARKRKRRKEEDDKESM